jgi:hypothetical protein
MANPVCTRRTYLTNLWAEGLWGKWASAAWSFYGILAAIREELLKPEDQAKYRVLLVIGNILSISFAWWVAIALAIALIWVFEASFLCHRKNHETFELLRAKTESQIAELSARYAKLSVDGPYSVLDSSSGAVSWRIKVHNEGASATNVQMNLCNIPQRPKSQFWSHDFPYRIIQVGRTLDSNECHIHRGCDAIFELTKVWPAAHNSGFITTLNTRPGSHQVTIEPEERLEMRYAVTAENTDGLEFIVIMCANSGGITLVRHTTDKNESLQ